MDHVVTKKDASDITYALGDTFIVSLKQKHAMKIIKRNRYKWSCMI